MEKIVECNFATESVDLSVTDFVPSRISIHKLMVTANGVVQVHFVGDPISREPLVEFSNETKKMRIDKIIKLGTTVADSALLAIGLPVAPSFQTLFGNVYRSGSQPAIGVTVCANIDAYLNGSGIELREQQVTSTITNAMGYFELSLLYGARALVTACNREEVYISKWVNVEPMLRRNIYAY